MAAAVFWKIGSDIERLLIGCQKNGERPAPRSSGKLTGPLVNVIAVRTLLSVHLYVYKVFIHYLGNIVILKLFMCHDMAPVACAITNTQDDWLIFTFCFF